MEVVRNTRFVEGFLLDSRTGVRQVVGCEACTRALVMRAATDALLKGWWSLPWGLSVPAVVWQNLRELQADHDGEALARYLARQGIDIDDVTLDDHGRSSGDRLLARAVTAVLHEMTWADGSADEREIEASLRVAARVLGAAADLDGLRATLLRREPPGALSADGIGPDGQLLLVKAACAVAAADGVLDDGEVRVLRSVGARLGLDGAVIDTFIEHLRRDATEEARIRAEAATVLGVDPHVAECEVRVALRKCLLECGELGCAEDAAARRERLHGAYKALVAAT